MPPPPPLPSLGAELGRLARTLGRARGARALGPPWRLLLLVLLALGVASRWFGPLPGLGALHGDWGGVAALALGLLLFPRLLLPVVAWALGPRPERLARVLDDAQGWRDDTSTALALEAGGAGAPGTLGGWLGAQTSARIQALSAGAGRPALPGRWPDRLLVAAIAFVFLAPGVGGLGPGFGRGPSEPRPAPSLARYDGVGTPAPLPLDLWLSAFAEDPPEVRALAPAQPPPPGAPGAPEGAGR